MIVLSPSVHFGLVCPRDGSLSQQFRKANFLTHSRPPGNARSAMMSPTMTSLELGTPGASWRPNSLCVMH